MLSFEMIIPPILPKDEKPTGTFKGRNHLDTSSRIIWNAISKWLATAANAGMSLLLVPFLLAKLGKEAYGLSALVGVIVAISALADMGLQSALSRQLAAARARKDDREYKELYASALSIFLGVGLACAAACFVFAEPIAYAFKVSPALMDQAVWVIRVYGASTVLLALVKPAYTAVLASHDRFDMFNHAETVVSLLRGGSLFAAVGLTSWGLYAWALANLACSCVEVLAVRGMARKVHRGLSLAPRYIRRGAVVSLFSLGGYFFVIKVIGMLCVHANPLILTAFLGPISVAIYRPPGLLAGLGRAIVMALSWQLHPLATRYHVRGQNDSLHQVLIRGTRFTLLIGLPICVFLIVLAGPITTFWLGKQLQENTAIAADLLVLFAICELCDYAGGSQSPVLIGMNRLRFVVLLNLPLAAANLGASVLLVGYAGAGIIGVLIPTVTVFALRRVVETIYVARVTRVGIWRYLGQSYARPLVVLAALLAVTWLLRENWPRASLRDIMYCALGTTLAWLVLCWAVGFTSQDRRNFRALPGKIRDKLRDKRTPSRNQKAVVAEQGPFSYDKNGPARSRSPELAEGRSPELAEGRSPELAEGRVAANNNEKSRLVTDASIPDGLE